MITGALDQVREGRRLCPAPDRRGSRAERFVGGRREVVRGVSEAGHSLNGCRVRKCRNIRDMGVSTRTREISPKPTLANTSPASTFAIIGSLTVKVITYIRVAQHSTK